MISRRHLLASSMSGMLALAMRGRLARGGTNGEAVKHCIVLWMDGGPSQFETFDPKPGRATGGPTKVIRTDVDELSIASHLAKLAKHAEDLNVIRTLTSNEGEHERAKYVNHTGFKPISAFPRPEIGSLFAHEVHTGQLPGFITLGSLGYGPAYLGDAYAPFAIESPEATVRLLRELRNKSRRFGLLDSLTNDFDRQFSEGPIARRKSTLQRVESLVATQLSDLLDLQLPEARLESKSYGDGEFARNVFLARRLIEAGVSCVEVTLPGWDTHQNNFNSVESLCRQLDQPWAALIDDLKERQLWDETLIIWMGDFGRTPTINAQQGRDHFPKISNVVLAGGRLPGGQVIGRTNDAGTSIEQQPVSTADLFATILHQFGVEPNAEFQTSFGSPTQATDGGTVISALS